MSKHLENSVLSTLRRFRISSTLAALVYLVLGVMLLFAPETARSFLCSAIALGVTAYGLLNILSFLMSRESGVYAFDLCVGVCALAFGLFSLINRTFLLDFLFVALGLAGIVGGISSIRRALSLRSLGYPKLMFPLMPGILMLLLALSVTIAPDFYGDLMMMVIGLMLIVEAVSDLFSLRQLSRLTKNL